MAPPPATTTKKKERTTPPPVPASLFNVQETNDWGDWDDMEFTSTTEQSKVVQTSNILYCITSH